MARVASAWTCSSAASSASRRSFCLSVSRPAPVCRVRRARQRGSSLQPRWPWMICWIRRRHRSRASPARRTTRNGSITVTAPGSSSVVAVLKPVSPSIATTSIPSRQSFGRWLSQVLNACLERPWTMPGSRAGPVPSRIPVRSMITVTYLSPRLVWRRTCSPAPIAVTPSNLVVSSIRARLPSARDGVAGGVPGAATLSDPGHGEVLDHDRLQRPPKPATRPLRSRPGREGGALAPHVRTLGTPVTTDRDRQRGGAPAERFVGELPDHGVAHEALAAAAATPLAGSGDPAREHGTAGSEALAGHLKSELVETAERGQIGARELQQRGSPRR